MGKGTFWETISMGTYYFFDCGFYLGSIIGFWLTSFIFLINFGGEYEGYILIARLGKGEVAREGITFSFEIKKFLWG